MMLSMIVCLLGCEQISGGSRVQINGEVTLDRKPLADVMVAFVPIRLRNPAGKICKISFGKSDNAGRFKLRTSDYKGVEPGEYRVLFYNGWEIPQGSDADGADRKQDLLRGLMNGLSEFPNQSNIRNVAYFPDNDSDPSKRLSEAAQSDIGIPSQYNSQSVLRFKAEAGSGILYPKFELRSHPHE